MALARRIYENVLVMYLITAPASGMPQNNISSEVCLHRHFPDLSTEFRIVESDLSSALTNKRFEI
jgi:hypothetical protein